MSVVRQNMGLQTKDLAPKADWDYVATSFTDLPLN